MPARTQHDTAPGSALEPLRSSITTLLAADPVAAPVPPTRALQRPLPPAMALQAPRTARAAVLFADIVGFTRICEELRPTQVIALLDSFHGHMARTIALHGAAIDDYIGDGVMAVWDGLDHGSDSAVRAMRCALAMLAAVEQWNRRRVARRASPVQIGIGLHAGEVVIGHAGYGHRRRLVVLGDTMNVASRLERLTRERAADLVASEEFIRAVTSVSRDEKGLDRLARSAAVTIRGRRRPVTVWTMSTQGSTQRPTKVA
jgi:adenylate cyclase